MRKSGRTGRSSRAPKPSPRLPSPYAGQSSGSSKNTGGSEEPLQASEAGLQGAGLLAGRSSSAGPPSSSPRTTTPNASTSWGTRLSENPRWRTGRGANLKIAHNLKPWEPRYLVSLAKLYEKVGLQQRAQRLVRPGARHGPRLRDRRRSRGQESEERSSGRGRPRRESGLVVLGFLDCFRQRGDDLEEISDDARRPRLRRSARRRPC